MGREVEGVKDSDFLGMGMIWEMFHWVGVFVVSAHRVKKD
jgi:hypothetical protein